MNNKQYNNVIDYTIKCEHSSHTDDSLATARAIFNNMGVALPQGDLKQVCEVLKTNNYMGWVSCTMKEAQEAADRGTAAIGVCKDKIIVLSATDEEEPVTPTASVMTISENTSAYAVSDLQFYMYSMASVTEYNSLYFENSDLNITVGWSGYNHLYGATTSTIRWTSNATNVVKVEEFSGYIQAVGVGYASITATTENGLSANFLITVAPFFKRVSTEKTVYGEIVDDVMGAQAFRVTLNMLYKIERINNNKAYITEVSAFTKYDKGNMMYGVDYPDLTIGALTVGNDTYRMSEDTRDQITSTTWVWDSKFIELNKWYEIGTDISTLAIVMLDASVFPYRDVNIATTLNIE